MQWEHQQPPYIVRIPLIELQSVILVIWRVCILKRGVIITLILLGKSLEAVSKGKTSEAIKKLMGLAPKTAVVVQDKKK